MSSKSKGKKRSGAMTQKKRTQLQLTRLNQTLTSHKTVNVDGVLQELELESYTDYLFKVYLPNRASVRFSGLSTRQKANLIKYLIVGIEVWQLITSDDSIDSEPAKWPGLATLKHGARLDEILDQYYEVLKLEESRRLFLANFAQALASSVKQEVTIDPPPPLKEGQGNVEVNGKEVMDGAENTTRERTKHTAYDAWVDRESRLDTYLRSGLYVDYGQLIITNDYVEGKYDKEDNPYAGLPVQALISPTEGFIVQGTPGSQSPDEKDENGNLLYPWPLYTNIQIVDEVVSVLKLMALAQVRNRRGTTQYHTTCGEEFKPYPIPSLQLTSLFYHPAIPEELKTLFQPIADEFEIKLNFVYPETAEELELFKKEYLPSQESLDGAVLMNSVLGTNTDPETADKIMSALLGAGTLTNNTLEGLTNLGLSDEDKVTGLADLVLKDDYSIFDKIEDGLGDRIKEVVDPILSNRASADTGESSSEDDNSTEVATTD